MASFVARARVTGLELLEDTRVLMRAGSFWLALASTLLAWPFVMALALAGIRVDAPINVFWFVVGYPLLEELVFRGLLQGYCRQRWPRTALPWRCGVTPANLLVSVLFAGAHVLRGPLAWALSVFVPSLLFGWSRDRFGSVLAPILLHVAANAAFALAVASVAAFR